MSVSKEEIEKLNKEKARSLAHAWIRKTYPEKFREPFVKAWDDSFLKLVGLSIQNGEVIAYVAPFLTLHPHIEGLNICDNRVGVQGVEALCNVKSLIILGVALNWISDISINALAKNKTLTYLDLSFNHVNGENLKGSVEALAKNTTLRHLRLTNNYIGYTAALSFRTNLTLESLWIDGNPIGNARYNLLLMNQYRKKLYDKEKIAFLSVMTKTSLKMPEISIPHFNTLRKSDKEWILKKVDDYKKMETLNEKKEKTLLFQYRQGKGASWHRLNDDLIREVLSFVKPKTIEVRV